MTLTILLIVASCFLWNVVALFSRIPFRRGLSVRWWAGLLAATIFILGLAGFLGSSASATGKLNWLPRTFEWPVGTASGVVFTKDGLIVVPLFGSGRIQVYDGNRKFLCGWPIEFAGGLFKLFLREEGHIHAVTAKGRRHLVYDLDGNLISNKSYEPNTFASFPNEGRTMSIPTAPWLLPLSNPFFAWPFSFFGFVFLAAAKSRIKPR
jgi:hypothetical protein